MLISTKAALGCSLDNREGKLGTLRDFFFDDRAWSVRYLVAQTGGWLSDRRVLLPPSVVKRPDWPGRSLWVTLTRQQIKDSPDVDTDKPVSRQQQLDLENYPAWAPVAWTPEGVVVPPIAGTAQAAAASCQPGEEAEDDPHLRSVREINGYHVAALDGDLGHVDELIIDDREEQPGPWELRYLVIDTRNWLPGRTVLVSPFWADAVNWQDRKIRFGLTREQIEGSPEFQPHAPINRHYEEVLYDYYGKPKYWTGRGE
jgi:hypothetical protein